MSTGSVLAMADSATRVMPPATAESRSDPRKARLVVHKLTKRFAGSSAATALAEASIGLAEHERLVLLGPSGCGKTTLLRCIAGLEAPSDGEIEIEGRSVFSAERGILVPPEKRNLSMVFQSYALWPHLSVAQNVMFPLQHRVGSVSDAAALVRDALAMVGCGHLAERYPSQLSGGQQQRVSLARAIVGQNNLILFDEPLSNVDARVRDQLRLELVSLHKRLGFSAIYVTHDQVEAAAFADRIAVMRQGRIEQIGSPRSVYQRPANHFVASFLGVSNEAEGVVASVQGSEMYVNCAFGPIVARDADPELRVGQTVIVMFRPEAVSLHEGEAAAEPGVNRWAATSEAVLFLGTQSEYALLSGGLRFSARPGTDGVLESGVPLSFSVPPSAVHVFPKKAAEV